MTATAPTYAIDAVLTVEQAAIKLQVSQATVRQYCHLAVGAPDRIPNFRLGNAIRIPYWALIAYIASGAGCGLPPTPPPAREEAKTAARRRRMISPKPRRPMKRGGK